MGEPLWCVQVSGLDTVIPQPDRATADARAQQWQGEWDAIRANSGLKPSAHDPRITYSVVEWPWSAEAHAKELAKHGGDPEDHG